MKKALLFHGGWDGHRPAEVAARFAADLRPRGLDVDLRDSLSCLDDAAALAGYAVIVPVWTMGTLTPQQTANLCGAVRGGVGLAGTHGGAGDAFRGNLDYEWMVGGHFVGHPHVGPYTVHLTDRVSPLTAGLPAEIPYESEQYYLMVDPGIETVAETVYAHEGRRVTMPVAWTKPWGKGRVFYSSLGHAPAEFDAFPPAHELTLRGILWAAGLL